MSERIQDNSRAAWLATAGVAVIPVLVPIFEGRISIGPLPVDAVILSVVLALVACIPYIRECGVRALPATGLALPVSIFLGVAALSVAANGSPGTLMTWFRYACYFALVPAVALVAQDALRRRLLMWATVWGGALTLLHATYQYLNPGAVRAIGMKELAETVGTRVYSTFENPNFYAEYLVLLFAVALALVLTEKGVLRIVAAGATVYSGVILLLTYTRGSWLALAVGVVLTVALVNWRLLVPLVVVGGAAVWVLPGVASRLMSIASTEGTVSFRMRLWRIAGEVISNHPFLGVGVGDFYRGFQEVVLTQPGMGVGFTFYGAHNSYFQVTAETGIVGGLAFTLIVLSACRLGIAAGFARYPDERDRLSAAALLAGVIAFSVNALTSNTFQHPRGAVFFFVVAGIIAGIATQAEQRDVLAEIKARPAGAFSSSVVGRIAMHLLAVIVSSSAWTLLTRIPTRTNLLGTSTVMRWVLGSGSDAGNGAFGHG